MLVVIVVVVEMTVVDVARPPVRRDIPTIWRRFYGDGASDDGGRMAFRRERPKEPRR